MHEQEHVCFDRSGICCGDVCKFDEIDWLERAELMNESVLSGVSGLLPRRDRNSNDPDVLLKRASFDVCRKNRLPLSVL